MLCFVHIALLPGQYGNPLAGELGRAVGRERMGHDETDRSLQQKVLGDRRLIVF